MKKRFTQLFILACLAVSTSLSGQTVLANFDFDGDLQGWTSNTISLDSVWQWSPDGDATQGAFAIPNIVLNSPTVANGCARFNSDFYITQGDRNNAPTGPPATYPKFICEFISPVIDLSGASGAVSLSFYQVMRPLNVSPGGTFRTYFQVSNDGGVNWSDPVDCNPNVPVNAGAAELINGQQTFPVTDVVGSSQVQIKFTYAMDFYYWLIDDVQLISRESLDMQANDNFYAIHHNAQTPAAQVLDMRFLCDISNVGGQTAENTNLNVTITDESGTEVYSEDKSYGSIVIDSIAENEIFGEFTPAPMAQMYTGTYTVSADGMDSNPDNNTVDFNFNVTDRLYAKDLGATRSVAAVADNSISYGNHYICTTGDWRADEVSFGLIFNAADRAAMAGREITIWLYKWTDEDEDGNSQESEREIKGFQVYEMTGQEDYTVDPPIVVKLEGFGGPEDLVLEEGASYIVALEYQDDDADPRTCFLASADNLDYGAMVFLQDSLNDPRYAGMLDVGITGEFGSLGFGYDLVPIAQLGILPPVNTNDIELEDNAITVFPNPASDIMNVDITLAEVAANANVVVYSEDGKAVFTDELQNVQETSVNYNVSNLPSGNYILHFTIDGAYSTKQFTVVK